jgi:hypothetical protein
MPRFLSDDKIKFLDTLSTNYVNIALACTACGISRSKFNSWIKKDAKFKERLEEIYESVIDMCESKIYEKIDKGSIVKGDIELAQWLLERKGKARGWAEDKSSTVNGIQINVVRKTMDTNGRILEDNNIKKIDASSKNEIQCVVHNNTAIEDHQEVVIDEQPIDNMGHEVNV